MGLPGQGRPVRVIRQPQRSEPPEPVKVEPETVPAEEPREPVKA